MSKKNRAALRRTLLTLSLVLVVAFAAVGGTIAWLTSVTGTVTNTFTVGDINITLDEAKVDEYGEEVTGAARVIANTYKLLPSHTYTKDPTVHVAADSEACYVFVKVVNGIAAIEDATTIANQIQTTYGWTALANNDGVYYKELTAEEAKAGGDLKVFGQFKLIDGANVEDYKDAKIEITAYAIQTDGIGTVENAWNQVSTVTPGA